MTPLHPVSAQLLCYFVERGSPNTVCRFRNRVSYKLPLGKQCTPREPLVTLDRTVGMHFFQAAEIFISICAFCTEHLFQDPIVREPRCSKSRSITGGYCLMPELYKTYIQKEPTSNTFLYCWMNNGDFLTQTGRDGVSQQDNTLNHRVEDWTQQYNPSALSRRTANRTRRSGQRSQ